MLDYGLYWVAKMRNSVYDPPQVREFCHDLHAYLAEEEQRRFPRHQQALRTRHWMLWWHLWWWLGRLRSEPTFDTDEYRLTLALSNLSFFLKEVADDR